MSERGRRQARLDAVSAHISRAAGQPGPRQRTRRFAAGTLRRRGRGGRQLRRAGLLGAEYFLLALALQQRVELLLLERLALDEDLGERAKVLAVLGEDVPRTLVGGLDDAPHLVIDLARDLVGVVRLGGELAPEERLG